MAPVNQDIPELQENIKNVIQDLLTVLSQTSNYDSQGRPSRDSLVSDLKTLDASLQTVHRAALALGPEPGVPETLIHYVENGRNPDIYTREFVELVRRLNQLMRGKMRAFTGFRDVLAREMEGALPELREDVRRVVEATGGSRRGQQGEWSGGQQGN
ncbi:transcription factor subunit Med10 of mediator complex-domain-containing protein [Immersiella caudata]|uniref:Mediator of RNA polymerase II transcription subunit 10 n=1 Tax=Immersiella caudata TaxID=314043 RepID=A0AA39WWD0_9PEZI|nr:transcription factor subunit Med10 of mediator complex-domain-containing protein [Immersiella caudata]